MTFGVLLAVLAGLFGDPLVRGDFYFSRDLTSYHYPMKSMIRQVVEAGGFPYWNPAQGGGEPMAANPAYEMFYPLQWLIFVGSFNFGYRLHIVVHVFLAATGMFLLLRAWGLRSWSCLAGALGFALSGPYLSLVRLLPFLFSMTWIPWIFYFFDQHLRDRRSRWFAGAAIALALQALVGEPIIAGETWLMLLLYAVWRGGEGSRLEVLKRAALLIALGNGLAAVQLIPGIDHARDSVRSLGFSWAMVSTWSLPPARVLEMLFPALFRHLAAGREETFLGLMYPDGDPFVQDWYLGLALIVAALALGVKGRRSATSIVVVLLGVLYVVALGRHTPLLHGVYDAGLFHWLRYTEKFWLPASFILVCCGAVALDRLLEGERSVRRSMIAITALWLAGSLFLISTRPLTDELWGWMLVARGAGLLVLLLAAPRLKSLLAPAILLFFFLDCAYLVPELLPTMPSRFFSPPAGDGQLQRGTGYRLFHQADWEWDRGSPRATAYFVEDSTYFWSFRNGEFPRQPWAWGHFVALPQDIDGTALIASADLLRSMFEVRDGGRKDWAEIFMAMSNVSHRAVLRPYLEESARVHGDLREASPVDFVPTPRYPRYYFADQLVTIEGRDDFVSKLTNHSWSRRAAFVASPGFNPSPSKILSVRDSATSATLDVDCAGRAFLVFSITPHKYWRVFQDGREGRLEVANIGYQGVELPAGRHHVELRYRNPLIAVGAVVSSLSALLLIFAARRAGSGGAETVIGERKKRT